MGKIAISKTPIELSGMDFLDYGDEAAFLRLRGTLRDVIRLLSLVRKETGTNR